MPFEMDKVSKISIHAPRMGSDLELMVCMILPRISIHAPRMGSDCINREKFSELQISIHAPRMGSDYNTLANGYYVLDFNPRSPHGERRC